VTSPNRRLLFTKFLFVLFSVSGEPSKTLHTTGRLIPASQQGRTVSPHPFLAEWLSVPIILHPSLSVAMTTGGNKLDQDRTHVTNCRAKVHQTWTDFKHCRYKYSCWPLNKWTSEQKGHLQQVRPPYMAAVAWRGAGYGCCVIFASWAPGGSELCWGALWRPAATRRGTAEPELIQMPSCQSAQLVSQWSQYNGFLICQTPYLHILIFRHLHFLYVQVHWNYWGCSVLQLLISSYVTNSS